MMGLNHTHELGVQFSLHVECTGDQERMNTIATEASKRAAEAFVQALVAGGITPADEPDERTSDPNLN